MKILKEEIDEVNGIMCITVTHKGKAKIGLVQLGEEDNRRYLRFQLLKTLRLWYQRGE